MRFVVALYTVTRTVSPSASGLLDVCGEAVVVEKERRTMGDSSWSTRRESRAAEARRAVGRGMERVLRQLVYRGG